MKLLLVDIESRPAEVWSWSLWPKFIGIDQIKTPVSMMSYAAKWYQDKRVVFQSTFHDGQEEMLKGISSLLDQADAVVTWNGDGYDFGHMNREFLLAGIAPPSPYRSIDLMKVAKKQFNFMSNKLDHVAQQLGVGAKVKHAGFPMWIDCMNGDPKAWSKLRTYNKADVTLMEPIYERLLPWIKNHPNVNLYSDDPTSPACPKCGGLDIQRRGYAVAVTGRFQRYQCQGCAGWFRLNRREDGSVVTSA